MGKEGVAVERLTLQEIQAAQEAMRGIVHLTPLDHSATYSAMTGYDIYLKWENVQKTGSFKIRGALNKIRNLSAAEKASGVIAASAGNHAQGVAFAGRAAGVQTTIVMPETAPLAKVMATRNYGAEVILSGTVYDEAYEKALEIAASSGKTFVHAFNDLDVIAGQGTLGLEIIEALPDVDAVVIPIGGGGLIAGMAMAIKEVAPHVKIYGVQAKGAPAMYLSQQCRTLRPTADACTIADGIAVKCPGELTFPLVQQYVDGIAVIDDEAIAATILLLLERNKMMVEAAGAVSLAAVLHERIPLKGKVACVLSGGNVDMNFISRIIERGLVKAGRRVKITTSVLDRPGSLQHLLAVIARLRANVISIYHDRVEPDVPIGRAVVEISLETNDAKHTEDILFGLKQEGFEAKVM